MDILGIQTTYYPFDPLPYIESSIPKDIKMSVSGNERKTLIILVEDFAIFLFKTWFANFGIQSVWWNLIIKKESIVDGQEGRQMLFMK